MKKNLLNLFIALFILTVQFSGAQPIINSDFESWSNNSLGRLDVNGWLTSNMDYSAATVVQDVPYSGSHSAKMVSIFDAGAGMYVGGNMGTAETYTSPHAQPGSLKGYFKQNVQSLLDNIFVTVDIYDSLSNTIGTGTFNPLPLTSFPSFTLFNAPISYTSSANMWGYSIFISFFPGTQSNAVWGVVDNIYFDVAAGIGDLENLEDLISVYPNPASDQVIVRSEKLMVSGFEIYNVVGKKIYSKMEPDPLLNMQQSIDLSKLDRGVYFINVHFKNSGEAVIIRKKIIKQ